MNLRKIFCLVISLGIFSTSVIGCASSRNYKVDESALDKDPIATFELDIKEVAFVLGRVKGTGILTYNGEQFPFKYSGFDVGSFSKIKFKIRGKVYNLDDISEFEGLYGQIRAGFSVGEKGATGMTLVNRHGTVILMSSEEEKGFDLALGRAGIKIKLLEKEE
ncbi:MAG: hypothetical protein KC713_00195 [Candidatus Omnitrophica bacterium]|nr:hypothetical protein [Candidatus Omnitrophota bacterium]